MKPFHHGPSLLQKPPLASKIRISELLHRFLAGIGLARQMSLFFFNVIVMVHLKQVSIKWACEIDSRHILPSQVPQPAFKVRCARTMSNLTSPPICFAIPIMMDFCLYFLSNQSLAFFSDVLLLSVPLSHCSVLSPTCKSRPVTGGRSAPRAFDDSLLSGCALPCQTLGDRFWFNSA